MIITCQQCSTRLQLEDVKVPSRPFALRCPKCQQLINVQPPPVGPDKSASISSDELPAAARTPDEARPAIAQADDLNPAGEATWPASLVTPPANGEDQAASLNENELVRLLTSLLQRRVDVKSGDEAVSRGSDSKWRARAALVCVANNPETFAEALTRSQYKVFVASNTAQALERMRQDQMDVLVLDPEFDPGEQGAAFVSREISLLRPAQRRRLFFVQLNQSVRTADAHAAFLNNVNLFINPTDVNDFSPVLERTLRERDDLYREYNKAMNVAD